MTSGERQRLFGRPAKFQPLVNLAPINAERFRPFGERLGLAERLNEYAVALVSGLFRRRGPAAIRGAVVGIYFNAVNRVGASWCGSHVGKEVLKFMPALANLDAAPAVACIVWAIGVMAALHHVGPGLVFLGLLSGAGRYELVAQLRCQGYRSAVPEGAREVRGSDRKRTVSGSGDRVQAETVKASNV